MNLYSALFILLGVTLNFHLNCASGFESVSNEDLLANDCEHLRFELCVKKHNKHTAIYLLMSLECIDSRYPTCAPDESKVFRSLGKFAETFCRNPKQICEKVQQKLQCSQGDCIREAMDPSWPGPRDSFESGRAYARTICIQADSNCTEKAQLNPPSEAKSFVEWYMQTDLERFGEMIRSCSSPSDRNCLEETMLHVPCLLGQREKGLLRRRLLEAGVNATEQLLADYCSSNGSLRHEMGKEMSPEMENYDQVALKYQLCDLREESAVEFAYSKAVCLTQFSPTRECVLNATGPMPSDKASFVDWFCRSDFVVHTSGDNEEKGDINALYERCTGQLSLTEWKNCDHLTTLRQIRCLPVEKRATIISLGDIKQIESMYGPPSEYFKCLSFFNEDLVNQCYSRVGNLSVQVNASMGENLTEVICNSNPHFYSLEFDVAKCLKDQGYPEHYISGCNSETRTVESLKSEMNCTLPIYGKLAEECLTKFTDQQVSSQAELELWHRNTTDGTIRLKFIKACLDKVREDHRQLQSDHRNCLEAMTMSSNE